MGSALWFNPFRSSIPGPPMPLFTLRVPPRDDPCKTRGQDGFAFSFPVGLFHPLQHAGLSRRSPVCRRSTRTPSFHFPPPHFRKVIGWSAVLGSPAAGGGEACAEGTTWQYTSSARTFV